MSIDVTKLVAGDNVVYTGEGKYDFQVAQADAVLTRGAEYVVKHVFQSVGDQELALKGVHGFYNVSMFDRLVDGVVAAVEAPVVEAVEPVVYMDPAVAPIAASPFLPVVEEAAPVALTAPAGESEVIVAEVKPKKTTKKKVAEPVEEVAVEAVATEDAPTVVEAPAEVAPEGVAEEAPAEDKAAE